MANYVFTVDSFLHDAGPNNDFAQGICVDPAGGRFWYTSSGSLARYDGSWVLQAQRTVTGDAPTGKTELAGVCYDGTKLYIGANNFPNTPQLGCIVEYDPTTLVAGTVHDIGAITGSPHYVEGCAIRNGEFWVHYHDWPYVSRFDSSWNFVKHYALPGSVSTRTNDLFQGGAWSGNYLYLNEHNNNNPTQYFVYLYDPVGDSFTFIGSRDSPFADSLYAGQGISFDEANLKAYWAVRHGNTAEAGDVFITSMVPSAATDIGNGWSLVNVGRTSQAASNPAVTIDTTGADLIVLMCMSANGSPTFTDSKGNTVTTVINNTTTSNRILRVAYIKPTTVGTGHTFTASGSLFATIVAAAFSGSGATPLDVSANANSATSAGSITPTQDGELILAFLASRTNETYTVTSGFTIDSQIPFLASNYDGGALAHLTQATAAAVNPVWNDTGTVGIVSFKAAVVSTDVTVGLTGLAATSAVGSPVATNSVATAGLAATSAVGSPAPGSAVSPGGLAASGILGMLGVARSQPVIGVQAATAFNVLGVTFAITPQGLAATTAVGTLSTSVLKALTGLSATTGIGSLVPSVAASLFGVVGTGQVGALSVSTGSNVTVTLTGVQASTVLGVLTPSASLGLVGVGAGAQYGLPVPALARTLAGVFGTSQIGTITASIAGGSDVTVALAGVQAAAAAGAVLPSWDVRAVGVAAAGAVQSPMAGLQAALTGVTAAVQLGAPTVAMAAALAGVAGAAQVGSLLPGCVLFLVGVHATGQWGLVTLPVKTLMPGPTVRSRSRLLSLDSPVRNLTVIARTE